MTNNIGGAAIFLDGGTDGELTMHELIGPLAA